MKTKVCIKCKKTLPIKLFIIRTDSKIGSRRGECTPCRSDTRRKTGSYKKWQNSPRGQKWKKAYNLKYGLFKNYGISLKEYNILKEQQDGRCKICKTDKLTGKGKKLHVDHCHTSNAIRGLLCNQCNIGLGSFGDSPETLRVAADYIEEAKNNPNLKVAIPKKKGYNRNIRIRRNL